MALGAVMFVVYIVREWSVPATVDNAMLVSSYANTAIFWLTIGVSAWAYRVLSR